MKTIIFTILILFSLGVSGQNDTVLSIINGDTVFAIYSKPFSTPDKVFIGAEWDITPISPMEDELLWLLDQYSTECYNDSVYETCYEFIKDHDYGTEFSGGTITMGYMGSIDRWVHKEPTFIGFIEWLKERQQ